MSGFQTYCCCPKCSLEYNLLRARLCPACFPDELFPPYSVQELEEELLKINEESTAGLEELEKRKKAEKEAEDRGRCAKCNDSFSMILFEMCPDCFPNTLGRCPRCNDYFSLNRFDMCPGCFPKNP